MSDRVALVTGGGDGIGAAVCRLLAGRGYRVVVVDVDAARAAAVAQSVGGSGFPADVTEPDGNRAMVAHALDRFGRLDVVVLNAGVASDQSPTEPLDLDRYRRISAVNVDGVVFGIDAAAPNLREGGTIVVTASLAGLAPQDANPLYAMTKAAVIGYVRGMAPALARRGIRIAAVCPSLTDTAILGRVNRKFLVRQRFPLLGPDDVAAAVGTMLDEATAGDVWTVIAGRAPQRYRFPRLPATLRPDGSPAVLRPFLAGKQET